MEIRVLITYLQSICPKVNLIARLEFELANYDVAIQYIIQYAMRTLGIIRNASKLISSIPIYY